MVVLIWTLCQAWVVPLGEVCCLILSPRIGEVELILMLDCQALACRGKKKVYKEPVILYFFHRKLKNNTSFSLFFFCTCAVVQIGMWAIRSSRLQGLL